MRSSEREAPAVDERSVDSALRLLRTHLGLDVAFVSQLTEGQRVFRHVDTADGEAAVRVGGADPAEASYCHHVVNGQVPQFLRDPADNPVTRQLAVTSELPVGTHFSVPIRLSDGTVYGTFCGFSHQVLDGPTERDLEAVRMLAAMVTSQIEKEELVRRARLQRRERYRTLEPGRDLVFAAQPVHRLAQARGHGVLAGYELLARFPTLGEGPAEVFADAWQLGAGVELETMTITMALDVAATMPSGLRVAVNLAPQTLVDPLALDALVDAPPGRLTVEVTEHAQVLDYCRLVQARDLLRDADVQVAVDDVGAGFSGLDQILQLEPDTLKLDGALVRDIDQHPGKRAMVAALVTFAGRVGAAVVAEQVETEDELACLRRLGVSHAQGYLIGRPRPMSSGQWQQHDPLGHTG